MRIHRSALTLLVVAGLSVTPELHLLARPSPTPAITILTGAAAKAHIEQAWATDPAKATDLAAMRAKGWTPTDQYFVVMQGQAPTLVQRLMDALAPTLHAQSGYAWNGEIHFWPWDDGDANTFESWHRVWEYSVGYSDKPGQLDISDPGGQISVRWAPNLADSQYWWDVAHCSSSYCLGSAVGCAITGSLWAGCVLGNCWGFGLVGCALDKWKSYQQRRYETYGCYGQQRTGANDC